MKMPQNNQLVGIVTVLYNSSNMLFDFFESLKNQTYQNFILYIINNNSPDNSLKTARLLALNLTQRTFFIDNSENLGIAVANNQGINHAIKDNCDYILLSNNDIIIPKDTIRVLLNNLMLGRADLVVPKIYFYHEPQMLWYAGGYFSRFMRVKHSGYREMDKGQYNQEKYVSYAPTCFMMINPNVFKTVGLMDEKYFVYWDDTDFIWRAVNNCQMKLLYTPSVYLYHREGASTGGNISDFSLYYMNRNALYFCRKHFNPFQKLLYYTYTIAHLLIKDLIQLNRNQIRLLLKAFKDSLTM